MNGEDHTPSPGVADGAHCNEIRAITEGRSGAHGHECCARIEQRSVVEAVRRPIRRPREYAMPGFLKYIIFLNILGMLAGAYY